MNVKIKPITIEPKSRWDPSGPARDRTVDGVWAGKARWGPFRRRKARAKEGSRCRSIGFCHSLLVGDLTLVLVCLCACGAPPEKRRTS